MNPPKLTRRRTLKGAAGIVGAATVGGLGLLASSRPSTATVAIGNDVTVSTDDGDLSFVDFSIDSFKAGWQGFDVPVAAVGYRDRVSVHGDGQGYTTIFDQRGTEINQDAQAQPVLLSAISSKGDGGDGWGGPDEYASTFDTKTALDFTALNQPGADGPAEGTAGWVAAGVLWRLLTDDANDTGHSIEDPAVIGDDVGEMDNPEDGTTDTYTVTFEKRVYLYRSDNPHGATEVTTQRDQASVYPMGNEPDGGTLEYVEAAPQFQVHVVNEPSSTDTGDGTGTVTGG